MKILSKSAGNSVQLEDRLKRGFKFIELQLLNYTNYNKVYDICKNKDLEVVSVHTPFFNNLENFEDSNEIYLSCELAQRFADLYDKKIVVVIHNSLTLAQYGNINFNRCKEYLKMLLNRFKDIVIGIENLQLISYDKGNIIMHLGCLLENLNIVKELNLDRVGTVIDICHFQNSIQILKEHIDITLDDYFREQREYCVNIHVACNNNNIHGNIPDRKLILEIMRYYIKYNFKALLTLEVCEDNVLVAKNAYLSSEKWFFPKLVDFCKNK